MNESKQGKQEPPRTAPRAGRRRVFRAWVGITIVMAVAIAVLAPLIEASGNTTRWVAILAAGMAALLLLGVGWLLVFVLKGGRRS